MLRISCSQDKWFWISKKKKYDFTCSLKMDSTFNISWNLTMENDAARKSFEIQQVQISKYMWNPGQFYQGEFLILEVLYWCTFVNIGNVYRLFQIKLFDHQNVMKNSTTLRHSCLMTDTSVLFSSSKEISALTFSWGLEKNST